MDFYRKSLAPKDGWKWNDFLGIFYRGDSVPDALSLKILSVRISAVADPSVESFLVDKLYRDKVKSRIEIHYKPMLAPGGATQAKG